MPETKTMTLKFYGSSDDNFCFDGEVDGKRVISDEVGAWDQWAFVQIISPEGVGLTIGGLYAPGQSAGWVISPNFDDEEAPPQWPMKFEIDATNHPYSPILVVEVPEGSTVKELEQ